METMSRKISKKGGLTIPKAIRLRHSLDGRRVHISVKENGLFF